MGVNLQPPVLEFGGRRPVWSLAVPFWPFLYRLNDAFVPSCHLDSRPVSSC